MVKIKQFFKKGKVRVVAYIDGFNLYHAIHNLRRDDLKWIDLRQLMECFIDPQNQEIVAIYYFSAIAEWLPEPAKRHKLFIDAQKLVGVTPILGSFKEKERSCKKCGASWKGHEEKQSDVNIAVWMVQEAFKDNYDEAFLVSQDSDIAPALRLIRELPKARRIKVIAPPRLRHSKELAQYAHKTPTIKMIHLERSRLPEYVRGEAGQITITRPTKYMPQD